jgi:hypothetical protein
MLARSLWILLAVAGYLLGAVGVVALPTGVVLVWIGLGLLIGALARRPARQHWAGGKTRTPGAGHLATVTAAALTVAGGLILAGLVVLVGVAGAVAVAGLFAAAVLWIRRGCGVPQGCITVQGAAAASTADLRRAAQPPQVVPGELSTPELCLAWRRSYFALLDVPAGPGRCEIVRFRERLLDELERRDPDGFTRWLDTGARAGSDPGRYLSTDR